MSEVAVGRRLGQYELHEEIGRGGMAIIYRASQPRMHRDVAIKVIAGPLARHPAFVRRFEDEVRACARLQHPHILPVYDVSLDGDQIYLVMAYMPGGTLSRRIAAMPDGLPPDEVVCITSQVASALDYAHTQGIIHRDLKPGNILLDGRGNAYLGDFGIAQLVEVGSLPPLGTYAYMAPELAEGDPASQASDIYSLGVVVFELLSGARPFEAHSREALIEAHADPVTPDVLKLRPDLPPGVQVVLEQALNKDAAARPPHAMSLAQALARACGLSGLPCAEAGGEVWSPEDEPDHALPPDEVDSLKPHTPLPYLGELGWPPDLPDTDPALRQPPPGNALPTVIAASTDHSLPVVAQEQEPSDVPLIMALVAVWSIGLCLLIGLAAMVVVMLPLLNR